jgi:hypothetical protein
LFFSSPSFAIVVDFYPDLSQDVFFWDDFQSLFTDMNLLVTTYLFPRPTLRLRYPFESRVTQRKPYSSGGKAETYHQQEQN